MSKVEIKISRREIDLEELGLINQDLFEVSGELAKRYNEVLARVFDFQSDLDQFRIDKRGLSPEVASHLMEKYPQRLEFPENYLNIRSANRFMLVVSPDQRSAPLITSQTSYDNSLIDAVHTQAKHTIEDITQSEALFGELDERVEIFRIPADLLNIRTVEVNLDTLCKTFASVSELRKMSDQLGRGDNALDQKYISQMQTLVRKVGDIRARMISPEIFPIRKEMHCFCAEFFSGVYCLRQFRSGDGTRTLFFYNGETIDEDLGESVFARNIHDPEVVDVLHRYKFLTYNPELVEQRIREVEDEFFLQQNIDVVEMSDVVRKRKISNFVDSFPKVWIELRNVRRAVRNKEAEKYEMSDDASYELKLKLAEPRKHPEVIGHLLAELDPTDPVRVYEFNRGKFLRDFPDFDNRKRYIVNTLLKNKEGEK